MPSSCSCSGPGAEPITTCSLHSDNSDDDPKLSSYVELQYLEYKDQMNDLKHLELALFLDVWKNMRGSGLYFMVNACCPQQLTQLIAMVPMQPIFRAQ